MKYFLYQPYRDDDKFCGKAYSLNILLTGAKVRAEQAVSENNKWCTSVQWRCTVTKLSAILVTS